MMKSNREQLLHTFPQSLAATSSVLKAKRYITSKNAERKAGVFLICGIFRKEDEQLIGHLLFTKFDWSVPKCDMGYLIDQSQAGKGYATESAEMLMQWAFQVLKMEKITLRIWPDNHASIAVARKLGAREAGLALRDFKTTDGRVLDCVWYEVYR